MEVTKSSWTMNHNTLFLIKKIYISQKGSIAKFFFNFKIKNIKILDEFEKIFF